MGNLLTSIIVFSGISVAAFLLSGLFLWIGTTLFGVKKEILKRAPVAMLVSSFFVWGVALFFFVFDKALGTGFGTLLFFWIVAIAITFPFHKIALRLMWNESIAVSFSMTLSHVIFMILLVGYFTFGTVSVTCHPEASPC